MPAPKNRTAGRCNNVDFHRDRRDFLLKNGGGFGALAAASLLPNFLAGEDSPPNPTSTKSGLIAAKAKHCIFLFMEGGPSHLDTFDRKPMLQQLAGQKLPGSFGKIITAMGEVGAPLLASKRKWSQHGKSGLWVSDWLPHIAKHADKLAVVRSCFCDGLNHSSGVCQMNSGAVLGGRPSLGSWISYGLGTGNASLPTFVVLQDNPTPPVNGPRNWSAGFMPAEFQGVRMESSSEPIPNLATPPGVSTGEQRAKLDLLAKLNQEFAAKHQEQSELDARLQSFELAFRMQGVAPEAVDLSRETRATTELYGMHQNSTADFGRLCLLARRMVERGVRFVQLYSGSGSRWDAHTGIEKNHSKLCASVDLPIAGLLTDLANRGLLNETLVVWGGEFGRTPMSEKGDGRDHNPTGFTMWFAGGGIRPGQVIGATDELGLRAVEDRLHVRDLHATILNLMGIDDRKLTFLHKGRPERPTQNEGVVCKKLIG